MHAIAINGSARKDGNTAALLSRCLARLEAEEISGELIQLADLEVRPCRACGTCFKAKDGTCVVKDDDFGEIFKRMQDADIIVVGAPVYFGSAASKTMALLQRAGYVARANGNLLSRKLGGPVAVARRAGENFTYAQLMFFFMISDMIVPGSTYWNVGIAKDIGDMDSDTEALETIDRFADNLAWLAKKIAS